MPQIRNEFKVIRKLSDRNGNFFIVEQEPRYGNWKIYVHLQGEAYRRMIGEIDRDALTMHVTRDRAKHYMREMMSYGFNYKVINDIPDLKNILMLESDGDKQQYYLIPVQFIRDNGKVKEFNKTGFEIQIFLREEYLARFKTNFKFEKGRLTIQSKKDGRRNNAGGQADLFQEGL